MTSSESPTPDTPWSTPRRRIPKWPFVLVGVLLALGLTVVFIYPLKVDYVAFAPGTVEDVTDLLTVDGETYEADGVLSFLTITADEVNVFEYIEAAFDDEVDLRPRDRVRPDDISPEEFQRLNLASMEESQRAAVYVALTELGLESTGRGALVTDLVDDTPAVGLFAPGVDTIVAVNGEPVTVAEEAVDIVSQFGPGDTVTVTVQHGEGGETRDIDIVLAPSPEDPERGVIGVFLTTAIEFPVDVTFASGNIGGSSAGLMWTLGIMNLLTPEDLTKGHRVAGTGTIRFDGTVGSIGGVRQKIFAARDAGAQYALVPTGNFEDAERAADGEIEVVAVDSIDDALSFFDSLEPVERFAAQSGS